MIYSAHKKLYLEVSFVEILSIIAFISLYKFLDRRPAENEIIVDEGQSEEELFS